MYFSFYNYLIFHLNYSELIEEDDGDSYGADDADSPDEEGEEIGADGAVIGEFIADNVHRNDPTYDEGGEESADREHDLSCEEVEAVEEALPCYGYLRHCTERP